MKIKIFLIIFALLVLAFQTSPYARRIRPVVSTPASCAENEIAYNMTDHSLLICTNSGYTVLATGASGSFAPSNATFITQTANGSLSNEQALSALATGILKNTTTTGVLSIAAAGTDYENPLTFTASDFDRAANTISIDYTNGQAATSLLKGFLTSADWSTFNSKESALTFDAPLSRAVNAISCPTCITDITEVIAVTDLTTYDGLSGTGTTAIGATFTSLTGNDVLTWNGSNWINQAASGGSLGTGNINMTVANDSGTGTTTGLLAKLTGAPSTVRNTQTTDTENAIGICTSGCGTTGSATIAIAGQVNCQFDGSTTAGNYVVISATSAGKCHDNGSSFPNDKAAYGRVLTTNVGAGTYSMTLMTPDIAFQNAGNGKSRPGGNTEAVQYNSSNSFAGAGFIWTNGTHLAMSQNQGSIFGFSNSNSTSIAFGGLKASGVGAMKIIADSAGNAGTILSNFDTPPNPGGNIAPWSSDGMNYTVTLSGNPDIQNPGNTGGDGTAPSGYNFILKLVQDGTGGRTPAFGTDYRFANGIVPTLSRSANAVDLFEFIVDGDIAYEIGRRIQDSPNTRTSTSPTNNTVTPSAITGLSGNIRNTATYSFEIVVFFNDDVAADGARFDFDGGTATFSNVRIHCNTFDTALLSSAQTTAIATDFTITTTTGDSMFKCNGTLTASANGTFIPRFAQEAHSTGTITVHSGSYMKMIDMP